MTQLARACFLALGLAAFPALLVAQTPSAKEGAPAKTVKPVGTSPAPEADLPAEQRRTTAISLLIALADDAQAYRDLPLRARVLARTADALWTSNNEHARTLFRRAWDAAEEADTESARRLEEDMRNQQKTMGSAAVNTPPNLRNEVLRLVARRDRALGEEFLSKIEKAREREARDNSLNRNPWMANASDAERFRLAMQLLQDGDVGHALQFADRALISSAMAVTRDSIDFLSALREKDAAAADQRFTAMLRHAGDDLAADANIVSGLSSYAFTPFYYVVFQPRGGASQMARRPPTQAPDLPFELRNLFFRVAAQILLRPSPPPEQDTTSAGRTGKYMVIRRLLPLFEKHAPERVAELRVQMSALSQEVPERDRTGENRAISRGIVPEDTSRDRMEGLQDRIDHAADAAERDAIYADMASSLAAGGDARARDLVDKIEDAELRKQVRAYTDFEFLDFALQQKNAPEAIRLALKGELTHLQRVWGLTQAARLLLKSDPRRATARVSELLEEATAEARRIDMSDPERARALVAVLAVFNEVDRNRVWELIAEAVKAANAAEGFSGDDARLSSTLRFRNGVIVRSSNATDFDLPGVFRILATEDFGRAIEIAKNFTGESARANAILAITRTALEEKQK